MVVFFFQAEDGIRDADVTGVQTCALPILERLPPCASPAASVPASISAGPAQSSSGSLFTSSLLTRSVSAPGLKPTTKLKSPEAKITTSPCAPWPLNGSVSCLPAGKTESPTIPIDISRPSKAAVQNTPTLPHNTPSETVNKTVNKFVKIVDGPPQTSRTRPRPRSLWRGAACRSPRRCRQRPSTSNSQIQTDFQIKDRGRGRFGCGSPH